VHALSDRALKPFIPVNSGALTETLLESELFGYTKGSFTGAVKDKRGIFEAADGGVICCVIWLRDIVLSLSGRKSPMRFFAPVLKLGTNMESQVQLEEKFGGLPWGLPANRWPNCRESGKPQSMIAQLKHHSEPLDLGKDGRVMFVFQCNHDPGGCET
jgi:hypothetical protein